MFNNLHFLLKKDIFHVHTNKQLNTKQIYIQWAFKFIDDAIDTAWGWLHGGDG